MPFGNTLEALQSLMLPDAWQAEAIQALRAGRDVIVDAPTGAGKTYVFERWLEQANFSQRALFTVPTRALANDKFAEWRTRGWRVGITTGDLTVAPESPVVVATLEAVQGLVTGRMAARGFDLLVVDEYQWVADARRGSHYEGVLAAAPEDLQLLLLSGSVANPQDVATWLQRLGRDVALVRTSRRPVPIEEVEADDLVRGLPRGIEGFWSRRVAGALRENLGPVLVFAPHRQDAQRLARQFARELPLSQPLTLTPEQEAICGPQLTKLLRQRIAYHHSGLSYAQRAGVIEPLAKAGQLRAVVATLGLAAGINFSLRSVMITASSYKHDRLEHEIAPHELLQMIGRAGRRGMDDVGYLLVSAKTPRLRRAAPQRLKRALPVPWAFILRHLALGESAEQLVRHHAGRFFTEEPIPAGNEITATLDPENLPCGQKTDTGRARLVRRKRQPFRGCRDCTLRTDCLALSTKPTLLWQWQRVGILDRALRLTPRGQIVSAFLGPEGLALAAGLEDRRYPLDDLIYDCANLFAGERFAGTNPRRLGRLAVACEKTYHRLTVEGYLAEGLPPDYGYGGSEVVRALVERTARRGAIVAEIEEAGRGDIDRLMTEWRSLLRQIMNAPPILLALPKEGEPPLPNQVLHFVERWDVLRALARDKVSDTRVDVLPSLPLLTAEQKRPIQHRLQAPPAFSRQTSSAHCQR